MNTITPALKKLPIKMAAILMLGSLALFVGASCSDSQVTGGDVPPPTIDPLPSRTNNPALAVTGTRAPSTEIWIQYQGADQKLLVAVGSEVKWNGNLDLSEGENKFVLFASYKGNSSVSSPTDLVAVILDTIPPNPPVVDNAPEIVSVDDAGTATVDLTGTKDENSDLRVGGASAVALSAETAWATTVSLVAGENSISLTSADDVGNISDATVISIFGSGIEAPTFDPMPVSPTAIAQPALSGTRSANTSLHLNHSLIGSDNTVQPIISGDEVAALSASTTWSTSSIVLQEGTNHLAIFSKEAGVDTPSGSAIATIVLDSTPPNPPVLDSLSESTNNASVTVTGTKDVDGNLCLRRGQEATCQEVASIESGTDFSIEVILDLGSNELAFRSVDALGNASAEVSVTVFKIGGPGVEFVHPQNQDVVTSSEFTIEVQVTGKHCSHDINVLCDSDAECGANSQCVDSTALDSVLFCVDSAPCETPVVDPATGNYTLNYNATTANWAVGTSHTIECRATNLGGFATTESISIIYNYGITNLSNTETPGDSVNVSMAVEDDGTLHFIWSDECVRYGFGTGYVCSDDLTKSCTSNIDCSGAATCSFKRCEQSQSGNTENDIFHRSFGANGWSSITLISDAGGEGNMDGSDENPTIAIDNDNLLHIAWSSNGQFGSSGGDRDIFHRTVELDNGNALGTLNVVDNQSENQQAPAMAAALDGTVHLVWEDQAKDIFHARWNSGSWGVATKVSDHINDGSSTSPAIATDSTSAAHIVWQELGRIDQTSNADADIYHRAVTVESNESITMTGYALVSDNGGDNAAVAASTFPDIAISTDDRVAIVWTDTLNLLGMGFDRDIFLRTYSACAEGWCSDNANSSWTYYQRPSVGSSYNSESARVAFQEDGALLVAWSEADSADGESNIKFTSQTNESDGLIIFSAPLTLMATGGMSMNADILVDAAGNIHFAWQDDGNEASDGSIDGLNPNGEEDADIFYQTKIINE